jgi:chemotaxis protein histidine kinase CheA
MADSGNADPIRNKLQALADELVESLPVRMEGIEAAYSALGAATWQRQDMASLHTTVHTLSGTTGSFGFLGISQAARELLNTLEPVSESDCEPSDELREKLGACMTALRQEMANPKSEEGWI